MARAGRGWRCSPAASTRRWRRRSTRPPIRLLNRHGVEVVVAPDDGCCGSLVHHMGREAGAFAKARANIDAWTREIEGEGLDAILITVSGCGTTVKDYGFMLRTDPAYADKAAKVSALAKDITEYLATLGIAPPAKPRRSDRRLSLGLLAAARTERAPGTERSAFGLWLRGQRCTGGHLCCGSAGTYNILQPDIARRLRDRKVANIESGA